MMTVFVGQARTTKEFMKNKKPKWIEISKEGFNSFISDYPNPLEKNVVGFCEPPLLTYNDFSKNKRYPKTVVATVKLNEDDIRSKQPNIYRIKSTFYQNT